MPDTVTLIDQDGRSYGVAQQDVGSYLAQGFRRETPEEGTSRVGADVRHEDFGGVGGKIAAGIAGGLSGLTVGASDVALSPIAGDALRALREEHPYVSGGANIVGALLPTILSGGAAAPEEAGSIAARILAKTPAAAVGRVGSAVREAVPAANVLGKAAVGTAAAAAEGALYGGGNYLSSVALENKPLSAEAFVGSMGEGALWAMPIGGALSLGESALVRARSLFPRAEITRESARAASRDAASAIQSSVSDGDRMAQIAQQKIAMAEAQGAQAAAGEQAARAMFGEAGPAAAADQVVADTARAKLTEAVQDYTRSRAALADWVATEADPDLEAALGGLQTQDVRGALPPLSIPGDERLEDALRAMLKKPTEIGAGGVPFQEFGAPGARGIKSPEELARAALGEGSEPRFAGGTPNEGGPATAVSKRRPATGQVAGEPAPVPVETGTAVGKKQIGPTSGDPTLDRMLAEAVGPKPVDQMNRGELDAARRRVGEEIKAFRGSKARATPEFGAFKSLFDDLDAKVKAIESGAVSEPASDAASRIGWSPSRTPSGAPREFASEAEFKGAQFAFREGLNKEEVKQALKFSRDGYMDVNRALRGDRAPLDPDAAAEITPIMDRILSKSEIDAPIVTHRAVHFDPGSPLYDLKPGDVLHDPGFGSTAWRSDNIHRFGNVHLVIESPAGTRIAPIPSNAAEGELTLARGTSVKITGREVHPDGNVTLRARVVAQDGNSALGNASARADAFELTDRNAGGSQGGKWFKDRDGNHWFGKAYRDPDRIEAEHLAGEIYRTFGVSAPETKIADVGGKRMLMSKELPGKVAGTPEALAGTNAKDGMVIDAWLGNRDVVGANPTSGFDNMLVDNGRVHRIDQGGALIYRGTGGRKDFGREVTELAGLRDPKNAAGMVFGTMTDADVEHQIAAFARKYDEHAADINRLIDESGLSSAAKADIKNGLRDRAEWLKARATGSSAAESDLESLLRGTKAGLDRGEDFVQMGEPAREAYRGAKAERTAEAAEHFRAQAVAAKAEPETELERLLRGTKGALDEGRSMGEMAGPRVSEAVGTRTPEPVEPTAPGQLPSDRAGLGKLFGLDLAAEAPTPSEAPALRDLFKGETAETARTIVDKSMGGEMGKVAEDAAIRKALAKHNGKNVNIGADLTKAAAVIGDHEASLAKLAEALGPEAPPSAQAHAAAYRGATAAQADAAATQAAQTADALGQASNPATVVDDGVTAALRKHDSAQASKSARAAAKADADISEAPQSTLSKAADVGTALEVLHALGVHAPVLSKIPVIGPILGLWFKARAVMGIMGRKGGSVGRNAESVIASKAAAMRDQMSAAVGSALETGAKGARKAQALAGPGGALASQLFPGNGDTTSKDPRVLYQARMDEIARAQAPGAIEKALGDRIKAADPNLQSALVGQVERAVKFLDGKAPKQAILPGLLPGDGAWQPSKAQLEEFGRYVAAVSNPAKVLEDVARGIVTAEGAETLRVVYPELYAEAQRILLQKASEMQTKLPYSRRVAISLMYQVPVDASMAAPHVQYLAAPTPGTPPMAPQAPQSAPGITGPLAIGQQTMTALERRAGA